MSLKEFLKPTKGKVILFAIMFSIFTILWLIPVLSYYYFTIFYIKSVFDTSISGTDIVSILSATPLELIGTVILGTLSIYLLSCIIITVKNKIKKK